MVDSIEKVIKKIKEHKVIAVGLIVVAVIIGIANFIGALAYIHQVVFPPSADLDVLIYESNIRFVYNSDNTTVVGFNTTIVAQITNTGELPVTIVACDLFHNKEGNLEQSLSNIKYLQPDESFDMNYTKYIEVSLPVKEDSPVGRFDLAIMYRDNEGHIKTVWKDLFDPLN